MKRITVLLLLVCFAVLMTASSVFAMTESFRSQATAGLFGSDDDDAADNIADPVDVIRKFPKWELLTRFSNILNPAGASSDKIFEYGSGDRDSSTPSRTFYGLMGSSEWFETNLGMPINFAISYERTGGRTPLLDVTTGGLGDPAYDSTLVTSANGDGYDDGEGGAMEFTDRTAYSNTAFTETNFTVGYKVSPELHAGLNWKHNSDNSTYVNEGDLDDGTDTTSYGNGLAGNTLTLDANDIFVASARFAVNDDVHVRGDLTLGYHREQDNRAETFATQASVITGAPSDMDATKAGNQTLPGSKEVEINASGDSSKSEVKVTSGANGLIFGLSGKVYYFPLNKGQITSKLSYLYQGGAVSKVENYVNEASNYDDTFTFTGTRSHHTFGWDTRKNIELEKFNVRLGLKYTYDSLTDSGKSKVEADDTATTGEYETDTTSTKAVDHTWSFPVGAELTLKENWTLRVGCEHIVVLSTDTAIMTGDIETNTVTKTASRSTNYTYGVGYNWSENLKLDINAFLEEPSDATKSNASIFDLGTYRNLAISATVIF
jgi:hypothetical protein